MSEAKDDERPETNLSPEEKLTLIEAKIRILMARRARYLRGNQKIPT